VVEEVVATADELTPDPPLSTDLAPEDSRQAFVRDTAVMSIGTALSRITGLVRVSVTFWALGVSFVSTTYYAANTTPNIVYELVLGGILTSVFVPVFVEWGRNHGQEESRLLAQRVLTLALVVLAGLAALAALAAPWIMRLYLIGSDAPAADRAAQVALGAYLLRWFMPQIVFYGVGAVATGVLQANRRFAVPMFAPILNNVCVIATMLVFVSVHGGHATTLALGSAEKLVLGAGTTFGVVAMTVALWPALRSLGFRWRPRWDWNHPGVRKLGRLASWIVVYVIANQLAYLVVMVLNNAVDPERGYTVYPTAFIYFQLPYAIFAVSIFTALLPGMSDGWAAGRPDRVRTLFSRGVRDMVVIVVPAALGYLVLAEPIIRLLAEYGAVDPGDVTLLAHTLQGFAVGLPFFAAFQLLTRASYATQDARTPALVNVAAAGINVVADLLFVAFGWGVPGLALGHAVSYLAGTLILAALLRRRLDGFDGRRIAETVAKVVPASVVTAAVAFGIAQGFEAAFGLGTPVLRAVQVCAAVAGGLMVFLPSAAVLRIQEVTEVKNALVRRFRG
jgi:putative peptidoglycan lipid II flippase